MSTPDRREFLVVTFSALGTLLLGEGCGADGDTEPTEDFAPDIPRDELPETHVDLEVLVRAYFGDANIANARQVGNAYIQLFELDEEGLELALEDLVASIAESPTVDAALEVLDAAVLSDFQGVVVRAVHGWQFAETELRLCALANILLT